MTSSGSAEHDRRLEQHVNCSVMVRYCSFQTGNEMRCDWCGGPLLISVFISVSSRRAWAVARPARWTSSWGSLRGTGSVASDRGCPQQRGATRSEAQIRWACVCVCVQISAMNVHQGSAVAALHTAQPYKCGCLWMDSDIFTCILRNTLNFGGGDELYWGHKWDVSYITAVIRKA